jgi:chromosome segregation protein
MEGQKRLYSVELEKGNRESQIRMLGERVSELQQKLETDQNQKRSIDEKLSSLSTEIEQTEQNISEYAQRLSEISGDIESYVSKIESANETIRANQEANKESERRIQEKETEQSELSRQIRSLTDDLVIQLDQRLRESGYSSQERSRVEENLQQEIEQLRVLLQGKRTLFEDADRWDSELRDVVTRLGEGFRSAEQSLERIRALLEEYQEATPPILDEFLAPEGIITQKRELDEQSQAVTEAIQHERSEIARRNEENNELTKRVNEYRETAEELRVDHARMKAQEQAAGDYLKRSREQYKEQERQREQIDQTIATDQQRLEETQSQIKERTAEKEQFESELERLRKENAELEKEISSKNQHVVDEEKRVKQKMDELGTLQAEVERLQMQAAETSTEIRNLYDNFQDRHSRELSEFEDRLFEIDKSQKELREELSELRDEQKQLGSVNLMAPEEFAEIKERYEFLNNQLEDLRKARQDLVRVTEEIRTESANMFLDTYERIRKNFHMLFRRLFGGGRAELRLLDPDNVLESGIDILVQPPGKKLENIALLSGGERSLTAVALLFATYVVKPSPFCVLDEIDAALDDSNVGRFVNMLSEFGNSSQFIIITHNKKTVAGAQSLVGVTMEEPGVSKVVSIRMGDRTEDAVHA